MIIRAKRDSTYPELFIEDDNTKIASGLLNRAERLELALQLIDAAGDLLCHDDREINNLLTDLYNQLALTR